MQKILYLLGRTNNIIPPLHLKNYNQRKKGNNLDKLWLSVENKEVLREKNINTGTNCIQLVSCEGIQISNIGQKRGHDNEELATPETKKVRV